VKRNKRWVYLYLNDEADYADAKYTAWPLLRVLRFFKKKYAGTYMREVPWTSIEVRVGDDSETIKTFKGAR